MSDLKDVLQDITGVGEATADSILDVLQEHEQAQSDGPRDEDGDPVLPADGLDPRLLEKAIQAADEGDERSAAVFLRRASR